MAIYGENVEPIKDITESWEGKSGNLVEDFICRQLSDLHGLDLATEGHIYDSKTSTLTLKRKNDTDISFEITVVLPVFDYDIKIFGLKIDEVEYTEGNYVISNNSKVSLLVGAYGTIRTTGEPKDKGGKIKTIITYESDDGKTSTEEQVGLISYDSFLFDSNFNITGISVDPQEVNISSLFTTYQNEGQITIKILDIDEIIEDTFASKITCETPHLDFNASLYTTSTQDVSFVLSGGTSGEYYLTGYNNGNSINQSSVQKLTYTDLVPGLNLLAIRATHRTYSNINSNWVTIDLICTKDCLDTVIAVNEVSSGIINNGIATLYNLTIYSPDKEEVILSTYLEEERGLDLGTSDHLIKTETITASSYKDNIYEVSYKKYIEEEASGEKFLMVNYNNNYYNFYTPRSTGSPLKTNYKIMEIDKPNTNFIYYKDAPINYCYDLITGQANNVFEKDNINPNLEPTDGWGELDGICYYQVTALNNSVFINPLDLNLQKSSGFSIELGIKTYNISNKSKPIMTLGKLLLWPTLLVWWDDSWSEGETTKTFTDRNSLFLEGVDTHLMITVHPNYKLDVNDPYYPTFLEGFLETFDNVVKTFTYNLVRVYINGRIDRNYVLTDAELSELVSNTLQIQPTSSDIRYYLLRVYNTIGLSGDIVEKNYRSFIFDKSLKEKFYSDNDIVINGRISFKKARTKYNTMLLVFPSGVHFPNYTWNSTGMEDIAKENPVTMFILYAATEINQKYGGRLNWLQEKGQGSSAKRYLFWNPQSSLNKFKDKNDKKIKSTFISYNNQNFDSDLNKFKEGALTVEGYYEMPTYFGQKDPSSKVKKSVGKINWASSMQSHKIGSCKLYDDSYKEHYTLPYSGKKAVHEEPFLYFYWETDKVFNADDPNSGVNNIELSEVIANDENVKFAGFLTWGAGKGDDFESGYDEDITPEYLMLEGGENKNATVNFRVPWHALQNVNSEGKQTAYPTITKDESESDPSLALYIHDESVAYNSPDSDPVGAWDIDFGYDEDTNSFLESTKTSLKKFREFYDFVYTNDFTFILTSAKDSSEFTDTAYKYVVTSNTFSINGILVTNHVPGDAYRYDIASKKWVAAGLYYDTSTNNWNRFNILDMFPEAEGYPEAVPDLMKSAFIEGVKQYIDVNDIAFHQAFIKFVSGTDNRAKNTYFQIIGPLYEELDVLDENGNPTLDEDGNNITEFVKTNKGDYKIRLIGDDLDTIFVTDNSGLQSKPYNLLEASYDPSMAKHWGDENNVFFYMFDICFEDDIRTNLKYIIDKAFNNSSLENKETYFYRNFFGVQEGFPAVAYNHTARLYYENAYIIYKSGQDGNPIITGYENNGVDPLGQSHGSCLECEKQFMTERMNFLNGYAQTNLGTQFATLDSTGSDGFGMNLLLKFTPYQDFYPNYSFGASGDSLIPFLINPDEKTSNLIAVNNLVKKDIEYERRIYLIDTQINQGLYQTSLYKTLNILGLQGSTLPSLQRGVSLIVDNEELNDHTYFEGVSEFKLDSFNGSYPVLELLFLRNMELPSTLDLTNCKKLTTLDLKGSTKVNKVIFPETGRLVSVTLPYTITTLELYNNPGLNNLLVYKPIVTKEETYYEEDLSLLETLYIDGGKCTSLNISNFCEKLVNCPALKNVTLRNVNITLTEEALIKLIYLEKCNITGIIKVVDSNDNLKAISFKTKEKLVNIFGNIDNSNNSLYVLYANATISTVTTDTEVYMYKPSSETGWYEVRGAFNISISSGNDVVIVDGTNPYNDKINAYLNIKYAIDCASSVAVIDLTGTVTLKSIGTTESANVTITITTKTKVFTKTITVKLKWVAPLLGLYAYCDGTFSYGYNPNKTIIGLVYAKTGTADDGTVYIIGKEFATKTAQYLGLGEGISSSPYSLLVDFYTIQNTTFTKNIIGDDYDYVDTSTLSSTSTITYNEYTDFSNNTFYGKSDTLKYVEHVNLILEKLYNLSSFTSYISYDTNYYISSLDNLDKLQEALTEYPSIANSKSEGGIGLNNVNNIKSILFPYFYSMYLYEPTVKDGEILHELYRANNWYAPSTSELGRIIYYRGYSVAGLNFIIGDEVTDTISTSITNGGTVKTTPIFTIAKNNGYVASCWSSIANDDFNNITTTTYSTSENWAYKNYYTYLNNNYVTMPGWVVGYYESYVWDGHQSTNAWRGNTHLGIPFTQFNYSNDTI